MCTKETQGKYYLPWVVIMHKRGETAISSACAGVETPISADVVKG